MCKLAIFSRERVKGPKVKCSSLLGENPITMSIVENHPNRWRIKTMGPGQNKRWRGRHPSEQNKRLANSRGHNSLNRFYESNGPDVKVRRPAALVAEKYLQLARDAQAAGDLIAAEGYLVVREDLLTG
jgi:Domain of unknown function (DUF4167)